jgi:hypothetical protein
MAGLFKYVGEAFAKFPLPLRDLVGVQFVFTGDLPNRFEPYHRLKTNLGLEGEDLDLGKDFEFR